MNMKSIRRILWSPKQSRRPIAEQLQLQLPDPRLTRSDEQAIETLRRLRQRLANS
jgi:hypothetical protein